MKLNKQTITYINSLVEGKAKAKRDAIDAKSKAVGEKREALVKAVNAEVEKILADAAKKVEAVYRKHGITPTKWGDEQKNVKLELENVRDFRTKFDKEIQEASNERVEFEHVVAKKQTEVVARLSLGGTAADLDEIIGAIEF